MSHARTRPRRTARRTEQGAASRPARPVAWVRAAAELFARAVRAARPLDAEVADTLKRHRELMGDERRRAVECAYAMLRRRRLLEDAAARLPFEPTREALVALHLVDVGEAAGLPFAAEELRAIERALKEARAALGHLDLAEALARVTPVPAWLIRRLAARLGDDDARALCLGLGEEAPVTVRVNTLKATRDEARAALAAEGISSRPAALSPVGLILEERVPLHRSQTFRDGLIERQDEGSQLLSLLSGARPGMTVVDGCAGAGGKTLHLAALLGNRGSLYALDVNGRRLDELRRRSRRAGIHNVRAHLVAEDRSLLRRLSGAADVVLVDAPCSGSGTLRRAPDIGWKLEEGAVERLILEQRDLLSGYAALVRPGGRLVYSTCSVLEEEGADVVERFCDEHPSFSVKPAGDALGDEGVALEAGPFLRLRPDRHDTDGFFGAVLVKKGGASR